MGRKASGPGRKGESTLTPQQGGHADPEIPTPSLNTHCQWDWSKVRVYVCVDVGERGLAAGLNSILFLCTWSCEKDQQMTK